MNIVRMVRVAPVMLVMLTVLAGCKDPTEGKTAATVSDAIQPAPAPVTAAPAEGEPAVPAAESKVYAFSGDGSTIGFEGSKVTGTHVGGFTAFDGTATVTGGDALTTQITLTIDMNSTQSDDPDLTTKLKSADFFNVEKFSTATFTSTSIAASPAGGSYDVTGNLTLHGVTKGITFPAEITIDGDTLKAGAEFSIDRNDWGIVYSGAADDLIRPNVLLYFEVNGSAAQ